MDPLLVVAAKSCSLEMMALLVGAGASVNAANRHSNTALMEAAARSRVDVVLWLITNGANLAAVTTVRKCC